MRASALMIALAIYGPDVDYATDAGDKLVSRSDRLHATIESFLGWPDEMKAELYARLEETLTATTGLRAAEQLILEAMEKVCQPT